MNQPSVITTYPTPNGNDKLWSILSHLSAFLGAPFLLPLIIYLVMKQENAYVRDNAREALNFHISLFIYCLLCVPLIYILIGVPLMMVIVIGSFILSILAAIKASDGGCYEYPLTIRFVR